MTRKQLLGLAISVTLVAAACSEDVMHSTAPEQARSVRVRADVDIARGIALAMQNDDVRWQVRDAMRASEVTEHKLVLGDFLRTSAGRRMTTTAAAALGISDSEFRRAVTHMPELDFYVPARHHRQAWQGEAQVAVALVLGADRSRITAYQPSGEPLDLQLDVKLQAQPVLFLIHEAEPKARRVRPQARTAGRVIQEKHDGEVSGNVVIDRGPLPPLVLSLASLAAGSNEIRILTCEPDPSGNDNCNEPPPECDPADPACDCADPEFCFNPDPGGGGGSQGPSPADTTFMSRLEVRGVCDNNDCNQGNEFEFYSELVDGTNNVRSAHLLKLYGVPSTSVVFNAIIIFDRVKTINEWINVDIIEKDGWPNPDDHFNPNPNIRWDNNARYSNAWDPKWVFMAGDLRCCQPNGAPTKELTMWFSWTPSFF